MKNLLIALAAVNIVVASLHPVPAMAIEDVTEKAQAEETVCHDICDEAYVKDGYKARGMPIWFFRKACLPQCLERMRCESSEDGTQWICRDKLAPKEKV